MKPAPALTRRDFLRRTSTVVAAAFAYAYLYSGSILVPVIMHALFNAVNIATALMMSQQH